jgi:hypothetical protein
MRLQCFLRDKWKCRGCGWQPDIVVTYRRFELGIMPPVIEILDELRRRFNDRRRHLHADHVVPIRVMPALALDLANLETLCSSCHSAKTLREQRIK